MPPSPAFKLRIFESECEEIKNLVLRFENIETGGDLFGLWTREAQPVIQLIIGPGEKCKRTSVSFHQDINYLQNIGGLLNTSFMLCHIGSWHSHHQLSLTHPSTGDHTTVRDNFPTGLERYIMIIANIVNSPTRPGTKNVELHPYMFSCEGQVCEDGVVELIHSSSPFRDRVVNEIVTGAERTQENSNFPRISQHPPEKSRQLNQTSCPPGYGNRAANQNYEKSPTNATSKKPHRGAHQNANDDQWYDLPTGKEKLKKIHEGILEMIKNEHPRGKQNGEDKVKFSRDSKSHDLTLEFLHRGRQWNIQFPESFDEEKARVFYTLQNPLKSSRSERSLLPSLSNNVIESIQRSCGCPSCELLLNLRNDGNRASNQNDENSPINLRNDGNGASNQNDENSPTNLRNYVKNSHRAEVMETDTEQSDEEPMLVCNDEEPGGNNSDTREYQELASITGSDSNPDQWSHTALENRTINNQVGIRKEEGDMAKRDNEEVAAGVLSDGNPSKWPNNVEDETFEKEFGISEDNEDMTKVGHLNLTSTSYDADVEQYSSSECNDTFEDFQRIERAQDSQNMVDNQRGPLHQISLRTDGADISDSGKVIPQCQWYESDQDAEKPTFTEFKQSSLRRHEERNRATLRDDSISSEVSVTSHEDKYEPKITVEAQATARHANKNSAYSQLKMSGGTTYPKLEESSVDLSDHRGPTTRHEMIRFNRQIESNSATSEFKSPVSESNNSSPQRRKAEIIQRKICKFLKSTSGKMEEESMTRRNVRNQPALYFEHGQVDWVIEFLTARTKLYKKEGNSRQFCSDVTPETNVVEILKDHCKCCRCVPVVSSLTVVSSTVVSSMVVPSTPTCPKSKLSKRNKPYGLGCGRKFSDSPEKI